ncbi:hypothetical protein EMCRGX_G014798 [Ephydatia muelleri]
MLQAVGFLAAVGLACGGHDESSSSSNKGNFLRLLDLLARVSPEFAKQRARCPDNAKSTTSSLPLPSGNVENFQHESCEANISEEGIGKELMQLIAASSIVVQSSRHQMKSKIALTAHQIKRQLHLHGVVCGVERFSFLDVLIEILSLTDILNNALQKQWDTL